MNYFLLLGFFVFSLFCITIELKNVIYSILCGFKKRSSERRQIPYQFWKHILDFYSCPKLRINDCTLSVLHVLSNTYWNSWRLDLEFPECKEQFGLHKSYWRYRWEDNLGANNQFKNKIIFAITYVTENVENGLSSC